MPTEHDGRWTFQRLAAALGDICLESPLAFHLWALEDAAQEPDGIALAAR